MRDANLLFLGSVGVATITLSIYLALDNDALEDAIKISDNFINNGIDVRMMKFKEKDPSEIGFENLLYLINRTTKTKFSDLMRLRLNGKTKKHMEIL